jgi:hypothetical protein
MMAFINKYFFFVIWLSACLLLASSVSHGQQSVGIGVSIPHPAAMLELSSATRGLLLPRMTSAQRTAIANPAKGLSVYETTFNRFMMYDGAGWRILIDNEYWVKSGNRVTTSGRNVGIGTAAPSEAFHVVGNADISLGTVQMQRSTGSVQNLWFNLTSPTSNGFSQGFRYFIAGTEYADISFRKWDAAGQDEIKFGFVNGSRTTFKLSGEWQLSAFENPILQFQDNGVDKGFIQVSATDNLRVGTNAGNETGQFIIRTNGVNTVHVTPQGNVGIGTASPTFKLQVVGNVHASGTLLVSNNITTSSLHVEGEVQKPLTTGTFNLLPLAYGNINADGTIASATSNVTATRTATGTYEVTVDGLNASCTIIVSGSSNYLTTAAYLTSNKFRVLSNQNATDGFPDGSRINGRFHFLVFKP